MDQQTRLVRDLLKDYASRGVFRSFHEEPHRAGRTSFTMLWHHDRTFTCVLDLPRRTVSFPALLPGVPARSSMAKELKAFLGRFQTAAVPPHRRIDPAKARLEVGIRAGSVSLALIVVHGEFEYAARRLVHLAQEVFLVFLLDGPYYDYRVEKLGLDPDSVWT
jgi:hypothetical protein